MGTLKPNLSKEPTFKGAYIRPILLGYSFLGMTFTTYNCFIEQHYFMKVNNSATLILHLAIFLGTLFNNQWSLGLAKKFLKVFIAMYVIMFFLLPVMIASYKASGSMGPLQPNPFVETVRSLFKSGTAQEQAQEEQKIVDEIKSHIFKVFGEEEFKIKVNDLFERPTTKKLMMKFEDNCLFKQLAAKGETFKKDRPTKRMLFDNILKGLQDTAMWKAGMLSGYGLQFACLLFIGLLHTQYRMIKRLWIHSIAMKPLDENYLYF